jgi:hypothetical protein
VAASLGVVLGILAVAIVASTVIPPRVATKALPKQGPG